VKINVVLHVFNEDMRIVRLLTSLTQQTLKDFRVIISDNLSTDQTLEIVDSFKDQLNLSLIGPNHYLSLLEHFYFVADFSIQTSSSDDVFLYVGADDYFNTTSSLSNMRDLYLKFPSHLIVPEIDLLDEIRGSRVRTLAPKPSQYSLIRQANFLFANTSRGTRFHHALMPRDAWQLLIQEYKSWSSIKMSVGRIDRVPLAEYCALWSVIAKFPHQHCQNAYLNKGINKKIKEVNQPSLVARPSLLRRVILPHLIKDFYDVFLVLQRAMYGPATSFFWVPMMILKSFNNIVHDCVLFCKVIMARMLN